MSTLTYIVLCVIFSVAILYGLSLLSNVKTSVLGNKICAAAMGLAIIAVIVKDGSLSSPVVLISVIIGSGIGLLLSNKVKMIQMPQLVALLNGLGGGAAAIVGLLILLDSGAGGYFGRASAGLALLTGMMTISGALVAAGKLHQILPQKPVALPNHSDIIWMILGGMAISILAITFTSEPYPLFLSLIIFALGTAFGIIFTIRVGGADMPITISMLNSLAGISGAIAGFAIGDVQLVAIGAIVGSAGLLLTQIMCRAMNKKLSDVVLGKTAMKAGTKRTAPVAAASAPAASAKVDLGTLLHSAKKVIFVPGYGMALAQAQHKVKNLADSLEANGAEVNFAVHPVAGRMPGHMNVLLAECNVEYEKLLEMDTVNPMFKDTDLVIVVGANDVINPAAMEAEDTPIYGMPILNVGEAKNVIICNFDTKPGYAGVDNTLYNKPGVHLLLGDASKTVGDLSALLAAAPTSGASSTGSPASDDLGGILKAAKKVIIVPGYGMALAQAQHKVKNLADALESNGAEVNFAVHPVAGRMPGHMNVLLAECNVEYEKLLEMDTVNPMFKDADIAIVVGANDVVNPAAMEAEDTPIYGMPILLVGEAKNVIICNFDTKPGYAGVDNPLYTKEGVHLRFGDAAKTVDQLIQDLHNADKPVAAAADSTDNLPGLLQSAKKVIFVPGYGMALAQAQYKVKQLAELLESKGAKVDFAVHPVAGRMPGHMNVLLAEANVDYEQLLEMDTVNPQFKDTDLVIVVGANDVINPAAMEAVDTPIYGMPILLVDEAKNVIICNYDTKPGYAGVDNPLYDKEGVIVMLGDASATMDKLISAAMTAASSTAAPAAGGDVKNIVANAKKVIIVPGYGMALAQAQHKVKNFADALEANGAEVNFAVHPVAGRMPGHMNVLLAEANVGYEQLLEMDAVNPQFKDTDLVVVVGANDVINPAAMEAVDTPIYGMPILLVDEAKNVIICNFDAKPGYAGVDNPLYNKEGVIVMLGDAAKTVDELIAMVPRK